MFREQCGITEKTASKCKSMEGVMPNVLRPKLEERCIQQIRISPSSAHDLHPVRFLHPPLRYPQSVWTGPDPGKSVVPEVPLGVEVSTPAALSTVHPTPNQPKPVSG